MQSEFSVLQGATHDLTKLKTEFEQIRMYKLNKYIIKLE